MSDFSQPTMAAARPDDARAREREADETSVDLRCSVIIFGQDEVLLLHRTDAADRGVPSGWPRLGESMDCLANVCCPTGADDENRADNGGADGAGLDRSSP